MSSLRLVFVVLLVATMLCHDQTPVILAMQSQNKGLQDALANSLDNVIAANKAATDTVKALQEANQADLKELQTVKKKLAEMQKSCR